MQQVKLLLCIFCFLTTPFIYPCEIDVDSVITNVVANGDSLNKQDKRLSTYFQQYLDADLSGEDELHMLVKKKM